ncbi:MAG: hypothetical protein DMF69_19095 [Acidobacteria bacterium]|nr:MAG: hypothetical protein DMF69_19095 [Acidobacteriota bacterium]
MSNDVGNIIQIIVLLVLLGMFLFPVLLFFIYVFYQTNKRKRIRERTRTAYAHMIGNSQAIPVRYASEPRFKLWFKIFPWEGTGLIVPAPGCITFVGEKMNGVPLNLQFVPGQSNILWLGKSPWPNGAVSWFAFDVQGLKHYFSSETGAFVFGSHSSTKSAYDDSYKSFVPTSGHGT